MIDNEQPERNELVRGWETGYAIIHFSPLWIAMNDFIIKENQPGWKFSSLLNKYRFINYDVALLNKSLKQLEGFQGHNIHETGVDFRIDRKLTDTEIAETIKYCTNDVEEAINIWIECKNRK